MRRPSVQVVIGRLAAAAALALLCASDAVAQDPAPLVPQARLIRWNGDNVGRLRALFDDTRVVAKFLNEIEADGDPSAPDLIDAVQEYRLVDLNADGSLELVALADVSGRAFFNNLIIVYQDAPFPIKPLDTGFEGFLVRSVHGFEIESLDAAIKDLDGDAVPEIVVSDLIEPERGDRSKRPAMLPEIYKWHGSDYEKASARFGWYYRQTVLPALERERRRLEALPQPDDSSEAAKLSEELDTTRREIVEARRRANSPQ